MGCRCPTCNANLPAAALGTLKGACPLGYRVLSKVRCACPLREQGCTWTGDFSEVSAHLTNSDSHVRGATGGITGADVPAAVLPKSILVMSMLSANHVACARPATRAERITSVDQIVLELLVLRVLPGL